MKKYSRRYYLISTLLIVTLAGHSQESEILDHYIRLGLDNNLALKQKELNLEKSLKALQEANSFFYPNIGLESQYFLAKGGRSIDFPIGDLLNPVYSSLNQILEDMGQPGNFPQVKNAQIQFLPHDYHETKIRLIMPLINAEIYFNRKIKKEMINAAEAESNVYKREIIKEIKIAYFRYLQAVKVREAYESALDVVNEAKRVNKKLVENDMAGPESIYRIESEYSAVIAKLTKADNDVVIATAYCNFLLNQPLSNHIITDSILLNEKLPSVNIVRDVPNREEIKQLTSVIRSADYYAKLKRSFLMPVISNITDIGYQGYSFSFNNDQQYIMNTISLSWPLFSGFQNRAKISQARIDVEALYYKLTETEQQIELQCAKSEGDFKTALKSEEAGRASFVSSREYYKIINAQYKIGQKSLLDLIDAQNQLTSSEIEYQVSHFESLIRFAELERVNAQIDLYQFTQKFRQ